MRTTKTALALRTIWLGSLVLQWCKARLVLNGVGADAKQYPVSKVVTLLRDMQKQLEKEGDEDEDVYEKMKCWCETNDREKTQSIQDAEARVAELTTVIETSSADSARLQQEITNHEEDLAKSRESLATATALREKQLAEFTAEEKDMLQSIKALDSAIVVLSKHFRGTALLDEGSLGSALAVARVQMQLHARVLRGWITPRQRRWLLALRQDQSPTFRQAYQPQSSEIMGVIKQMKATFESNLAQTQGDESENRKQYEGLKAAKEAEILATQSAIEQKRAQLAGTDERHAHAKQDIDDTRSSLSTDDQFLLDLKQQCTSMQHEWETRTRMRQEEISAIVEAVSILSKDEARDTFSRTFNPPAFLQARGAARLGQRHGQRRDAGAAALLAAAARSRDPRLAALALAARRDPLAQVKGAIDGLIAELVEEKQLEAAQRDGCVDRRHENELSTERYQREHSDLEAKARGLQGTITELHEAIKSLESEIANLQLQIKRRGEDRETENRDFQATLSDQHETQALLQKALVVLRAVYAKQEVHTAAAAPALTQMRQATEPPQGFGSYGQGRAAGGVVALIEQIIRDAENMEKQTLRDEQAAQQEYESVVKNTNVAIQSKQQGIVHKSQDVSRAEADLVLVREDIRSSVSELDTLANAASAIQLECDFIVKNFDIRQEARDQEVEALQEAKAILMGMKLEA